MVRYERVWADGHGWLPCRVCDQCSRRQHMDMIGLHGSAKLANYWFDSLACLHDAEKGVIPDRRAELPWDVPPKPLRDLPCSNPAREEDEGWQRV